MLHRTAGAALAGLALFFAAPRGARADKPDPREIADAIESQARAWLPGTIERTRRSIAIGPLLGGHLMAPTSSGQEVDGVLSFGLELLYFDVPTILDPGAVEEILVERSKAKLKKAVARAMLQGKRPSEAEIKQMAARSSKRPARSSSASAAAWWRSRAFSSSSRGTGCFATTPGRRGRRWHLDSAT